LTNMSTPLLSICIATYNRAGLIGQTLDSIVSQVKDQVEIIVVDGASPDDTASVVQRYQAQYPFLRYYRLPAKGGVDRDYCHAVSLATGEYCWLMTDDDIVKPRAIDTILDLLARKYSLIVLNAEVWDQALTKRLESQHLPLDVDTFYQPSSLEAFFLKTITHLSFIGAVVINRVLWMERIKEPYIGTEFIHVGVVFQKELPYGALVMTEPCIAIRYGNAQWAARYFEIWMIKWPDLIWSFPDISDAAKLRICPRKPWDNALTLLILRAYGAYSVLEYDLYVQARQSARRRRFIAKLIAHFPGFVANVLAVMYYSLKSSHDYYLWHSLKTSRFYYRQYFHSLV